MIIAMMLASMTASPATLPAMLIRARPGDTIRLQPGDYGRVVIRKRRWTTPVTIDAGAARMVLWVEDSSGIAIRGGVFGPAKDALGYAARLSRSSKVSFDGSRFVDSKRGLIVTQSSWVNVRNAVFTGMTVDGMNIASSQHVMVQNSRCENFITGKAHPDCVQLWSRPQTGITSDVTLVGNSSIGNMQGFTAFNHVRGGVDDGGFDRIVIRDNIVQGLYPQGIALYDCRNCAVTGNRTSRLPGARWKVSVNVVRCRDCEVKDNRSGG